MRKAPRTDGAFRGRSGGVGGFLGARLVPMPGGVCGTVRTALVSRAGKDEACPRSADFRSLRSLSGAGRMRCRGARADGQGGDPVFAY